MRRCFLVITSIMLASCSLFVTPVAPPTATPGVPTSTAIIPTSLPAQTLEPFEEYTIDHLRQRTYGGGTIEVLEKLAETELFTSYSIRYPSDGLTIYGFVNVPKSGGPFPVIVSVHGYSPPDKYDLFNHSQDSADFFAENGFMVVHPGLRNYPPSDFGDNLLRVGMTIDVMNLVALLQQKDDLPMEMTAANVDRLGLWGNSMGGEIALRLLTIRSDIDATVLTAPLSGNPVRNSKQLYDVLRDSQFQSDERVPLKLRDQISAMNYYHRITSVVQLHHGTADTTVPISWSKQTCDLLESAGVSVQCIYYKNTGHVFHGSMGDKLRQNALAFYQTHLLP